MTVLEASPKPFSGEKQKEDFIKVKFEDGKMHEIPHPLLEVGHDDRQIKSDDMVKVSLYEYETELPFEKCLEIFFGTTYSNYFRVLKENPNLNQLGVVRQLHLEVIEKRRQEALMLDEKFSGGDQASTAKEHSPMFVRYINELGIDGISAEIGQLRNDYKDKIDDFIVVDPARLQEFLEGEVKDMKGRRPIYIGVQRTFDISAAKRAEIINDPVKLLPENPGEPIFVVFLEEDKGDYISQPDTNQEYALWQKMLDMRMDEARKAGKKIEEYLAEIPGEDRLPLLEKILPKGFPQQRRKAIKIFKEIIAQWQTFKVTPKFKALPSIVRKKLEENFAVLEKMDIPKVIKEET